MCDKNGSIMQFTLYSESAQHVQVVPQELHLGDDIEIHSYWY